MPFLQEPEAAEELQPYFGKYHSTFHSSNGQVTAYLFQQDEWLIAHVAFASGLDATDVTDSYWGELSQYAVDHGFKEKFRILLS